jgi:hypothetical protein
MKVKAPLEKPITKRKTVFDKPLSTWNPPGKPTEDRLRKLAADRLRHFSMLR